MKFGFLNIDKPSGVNSTAVVNRIKRLTALPCGHMGTLDPLASGVLPVGVGRASRLFDYFLQKEKRYLATFRFGVTSDTLDAEGEAYGSGRIPDEAEILAVLPRFLGEIAQIPPRYSAKSVGGRRGYQLARAGVEFTLAPKTVHISSLSCRQISPDSYEFAIVCGGGTYIRSLARDIAEACGTIGLMSSLRRTQSGIFTLDTAVSPELLTPETVERYLIPTEEVLPFPVYAPEGRDAFRLFNGVAVESGLADGDYKLYREGEFYGVARAEGGKVLVKTKLC